MATDTRPLMMSIRISPPRDRIESANNTEEFLLFLCQDDKTGEEHRVEFQISQLTHSRHRSSNELIFVATDRGGARYSAVHNHEEGAGSMMRVVKR